MNNGALGMIHLSLERNYGSKGLKSSDFLDVDYGKVARSFGAYGERVTRPSELRGTITSALDSGKPAVIDVVVDLHELSPMSFYRKLPNSRNL